jgi:phosphohistidine phosphatase
VKLGTATGNLQYSLTMKRLLILRHGKSDWHAPVGSDHERPLAARGVAAAKRMGRFLQQKGQVPEKVISSSAARARATASTAMAAGSWVCPVVFTDTLYGASVATVIALVQSEDDGIFSLLLVGHEPTWSALISNLTGGGDIRFPTAALARIDFETNRWEEVGSGTGTLRWLVTPKLLNQV